LPLGVIGLRFTPRGRDVHLLSPRRCFDAAVSRIGRELIRRTHEAAGLHTTLMLLAAPKAQSYYPHIGMSKHESCWIIARRPRQE